MTTPITLHRGETFAVDIDVDPNIVEPDADLSAFTFEVRAYKRGDATTPVASWPMEIDDPADAAGHVDMAAGDTPTGSYNFLVWAIEGELEQVCGGGVLIIIG